MSAADPIFVANPELQAPHSWGLAARCMSIPRDPLMKWLRDSDLPGTAAAATDSSWMLPDRESFLRLLCGEKTEPTLENPPAP